MFLQKLSVIQELNPDRYWQLLILTLMFCEVFILWQFHMFHISVIQSRESLFVFILIKLSFEIFLVFIKIIRNDKIKKKYENQSLNIIIYLYLNRWGCIIIVIYNVFISEEFNEVGSTMLLKDISGIERTKKGCRMYLWVSV